MDAKGPVTLCDDRALPIVLSCDSVLDVRAGEAPSPLTVDEVIGCLQQRWQASYDLQLVVRRGRLYLHVMWAYLEQQSFPLDENAYREHIAEVIDVVNRLAQAQVVRESKCYKKMCSTRAGFPLLSQLYGTFQDSDHLYMLMEFLQGGELYGHLYEEFSTLTGGKGGMKLKDARFYIACVALIFEYLHDKM